MKHPLLELGFRPFYLLAAVYAVFAVALWSGFLSGLVPVNAIAGGTAWHRHEMVFGFSSAVIAGFLLTAVKNWTGRTTANGPALAVLAGLWIAGRIFALSGPGAVAAFIDGLFLPMLAIALAVPIWQSGNRRNIVVVVVVLALAAANIVYHLAAAGEMDQNLARGSIFFALDVITILMAIIAGRVIPAFTKNAVVGANVRRNTAIEVLSIGTLVVIVLARGINVMYPLPSMAMAMLFGAAALAHGIRLALWNPAATRGNMLLAMLPIAYAWIPISLALMALASISLVPQSAAVHALTIGAMSSLMMAMMTRSSLGHTGRMLKAGPIETAAFILLQLATLARVGSQTAWPSHYLESIMASAVLWALAFAIFLLRYLPILTRPGINAKA